MPSEPDHSPRVGVVVVAAGESRRMGGLDKLFLPLAGRPLLLHCLSAFESSLLVRSIVIAASAGSMSAVRELVEQSRIAKVMSIVAGGGRRQDSVAAGLDQLVDIDLVIVHDGARPFIDHEIICSAVVTAQRFGAATAAVPVKDTIKVAKADMTVERTPPRQSLWAAQTPQAFSVDLLRTAHATVEHEVTDDAAMIEAMGHSVKLFMGAYDNIKVTTPEDIPIAEAIAHRRRQAGVA